MEFTLVFLIFFKFVKQTPEKNYRKNDYKMKKNEIPRFYSYDNPSDENDILLITYFTDKTKLYIVGNSNMGSLDNNSSGYFPQAVETQKESSKILKFLDQKDLHEDNNENSAKKDSITHKVKNMYSKNQPNQHHHNEPEMSKYQKHDLFQRKTYNTISLSENQCIETINKSDFDNISYNKTDQNPSFEISIEEIKTTLFYKQLSTSISRKLYNVWLQFSINELNNYDSRLLTNFKDFNEIKNWNKLDENCEMFQKDMREGIEFHHSEVFKNITIFRQKSFKKRGDYSYDYLFIEGEPKKHLKNLRWSGTKIFIMDCAGIGKDVHLSGYTYIGPNCKIGDNTFVHNSVFMKKDVEIQKKTFIGCHNYFGKGCKIGILNQDHDLRKKSGLHSIKNSSFSSVNVRKRKFITTIGFFNFFGDNFEIPYGNRVGYRSDFR